MAVVNLEATVPVELAGQRLDQVLPQLFGDYSRSRFKHWIEQGCVSIDGRVESKPRLQLLGGEALVVAGEIEEAPVHQAEAVPLDVIYEDDEILVINKPADWVVHPGAGNTSGTLLNALLHHAPQLAQVPRAGIVHRLDKDTTGLLVVAKTIPTQINLVEQLQRRSVTREYEAVVVGRMTAGGTVDEPIGRHPTNRLLQAVTPTGKEAVTHYRVMERFRQHTRLRLRLETGRTHQIRVHMAHIHHPLLGDQQYGGRLRLPKGADEQLVTALRGFRRQALHAVKLALIHPVSGELVTFDAPLPEEQLALNAALRADMQRLGDLDAS
ncbi:MAG: 23S rRNA pseudouridine(1911/1915/1917) synthase RluD [Gammaproteobacteria bacterium]|nr:23S rRNA pseudouridine(1911/1915/1917) synthase RluD [Gammaproteobacteria bacterium]